MALSTTSLSLTICTPCGSVTVLLCATSIPRAISTPRTSSWMYWVPVLDQSARHSIAPPASSSPSFTSGSTSSTRLVGAVQEMVDDFETCVCVVVQPVSASAATHAPAIVHDDFIKPLSPRTGEPTVPSIDEEFPVHCV